EQRRIELWIAGAGADESQIKAHAAEHGADFVRFLGHVSGEEKWQVLEDADLLLFPTCHPEGLSNSVLEAMLHGLPILTRPEGALGEILTDDVNGFITSSTDPAVFAEQLARLANDDELRERISRFNREQAESRF